MLNSGTIDFTHRKNRDPSPSDRQWWPVATGALVVAGTILFAIVTQIVPRDMGRRWIADDGFVQILTFCILVGSAVLAVVSAKRHRSQRLNLYLAATMLLVYAAREADLHRASWMPKDFTSVRLYSAADVPLWQKAACGMLMFSIIVTAAVLTVRVLTKIRKDIRSRRVWLLMAAIWLVVFAVSQASDQSSWNEVFRGQAFEEVCECVASGFAALAVFYFPKDDSYLRRFKGTHDRG